MHSPFWRSPYHSNPLSSLRNNNPPRFIEKKFPQFYPRYLHILRVDPDKIDKVEKATVWGARQDDVEGGKTALVAWSCVPIVEEKAYSGAYRSSRPFDCLPQSPTKKIAATRGRTTSGSRLPRCRKRSRSSRTSSSRSKRICNRGQARKLLTRPCVNPGNAALSVKHHMGLIFHLDHFQLCVDRPLSSYGAPGICLL